MPNRFFGSDCDDGAGDPASSGQPACQPSAPPQSPPLALPEAARRPPPQPQTGAGRGPRGASRIGLVVGNAAYPGVRLKNPVNDATLIAGALRALSFDVELLADAGKAQLEHAMVELGARLADAGPDAVGLFYFAGHGVQHLGQNYLIPVDARIPDERYLRSGAIRVDFLIEELARARCKASMVVLDACRNNPLAIASQGAEALRGLAAIERVPDATAIVFSTAAGSVAGDGEGDNSPYALALARALARPQMRLQDIVFEAAGAVAEATGGRQRPALFVQGALPDVMIGQPRPKPASATARAKAKGPWGNLPDEPPAPDPAKAGPLGAIPDPLTTIERPTPMGVLRYGLSPLDWEQGFPGDLVNEVLDTGRWPEVEKGFAQREPYAATLVAIRRMTAIRPDWGETDQDLAARAALIGAGAGIRQAFVVIGWLHLVGGGGFERKVAVDAAIVGALAERGYRYAELMHGIRLAHGDGEHAPQPAAAIGWLEQAAAKGANAGLYEIGLLYTDLARHPYRIDLDKARHYLERAAATGHSRAAAALAGLYVEGKLAIRSQDEVNGLIALAAGAGEPKALYLRALRQEHGDGVPQSLAGAMTDLLAAARAGSTQAMLALSHHYAHGNACTPPAPAQAVEWAETAAGRGEAAAFALLGGFHEAGFGAEVSSRRAAEYFRQAHIARDPRGHIGMARLHARSALGPRDNAEIERHCRLAKASGLAWAIEQADAILDRLGIAERLATVPAIAHVEDITEGAAEAPVTLVALLRIEDTGCAQFYRDVLGEIRPRLVASGHVRLIVREGPFSQATRNEAGLWALVRCLRRSQQLPAIGRLLERQPRWLDAGDRPAALAAALADAVPDLDAQAISTASAAHDLVARVHYMANQVSPSFGVGTVPTVFVNGRKLERPSLAALAQALGEALPPELARGLTGPPRDDTQI